MTAHRLQKGVTPFVRKQAALNLRKTVSGIATILGTAHALDPKSVELDPRSADFGKIRIGDTRFDMSAGMGALMVLAARMVTHSSKSSTTGKVSQLNERDKKGNLKFGTTTTGDVFTNFFTNKLSPAASVIKDIWNQSDFNGNKPTIGGEARNLVLPLPIDNLWSAAQDKKHADLVLTAIADGLGISTNTYGNPKKH